MINNETKLKNFLTAYQFEDVCEKDECSSGVNDLSFSYKQKVDTIHDILRSRFHTTAPVDTETGEADTFTPTNYNQIYAYYRTYHQLGDIDTKNISLYNIPGTSNYRTKLLQGLLKQHMNNTMYGKFTDELSRVTAGYGNGIVKIVEGVPYICNPLNVYYDNNVRSIQKTSIAERFTISYEEAIVTYPEFIKEFDLIYEKTSESGFNYIHMVNFNSWYEIDGKIQKGVGVFLDKNPALYNNPGYTEFVNSFIDDGGDFKELEEIEVNVCTDWRYDMNGNKVEQLFNFVVAEAFPVDGEIRSQGIVELLMPLQARYNQLMERLDRVVNSSLGGVKIHEFDVGFESDLEEEDLRNMKPDEILTMTKDKQNLRAIVDNSTVHEANTILSLVENIKNMMQEISGVTNFAIKGEMIQSAKATTSAAITSASQTPIKKFVERMGQAHSEIIGNFILPYLIENTSNEVVLDSITKSERQEIIREAAKNEVNKNWKKYGKAVYEKTKSIDGIAARGVTAEDYEPAIQKIIDSWDGKLIKFTLGDWSKKLGSTVNVDVDNEFADKERKFNNLVQVANLPMMQGVLKAQEVANELLRNSDVDNYSFVKTEAERKEDERTAMEMEVFKNEQAQQVAAENGDYGNMGGRPSGTENRIAGQGINIPQTIM